MPKGGNSKKADPITPAQWAAAKQAYYAPGYLEATEGLSQEKYNQIAELMRRWDDMTPGERRAFSGNYQKWRSEYSVAKVGGKEELQRCAPLTKAERNAGATESVLKLTSHQGRMFEDVKGVHVAGYCPPPALPLGIDSRF